MAENEDWLQPAVVVEAVEEPAQEPGKEATQDAADPVLTATDPNEALTAKIKGLEAAATAERHKRQEIERQLAEKEKPYLGEEYEARFLETRTEFQQQLLAQKLDLSEDFARQKYADFGDKLEVFKGLVQTNPALYQQMVQQANPAEFVYKTATNQQKLQEMGDPSEYESKIRADERAKVEAELVGKNTAEAKKRADLPGSIATASGVGGATAQTWSGPTSLDDLLK